MEVAVQMEIVCRTAAATRNSVGEFVVHAVAVALADFAAQTVAVDFLVAVAVVGTDESVDFPSASAVLIVAVGIGLQGFESTENAEAFAAVVAGADHAHQTSWRGIAAATFPLFPNALASNLSAPARITICTPGIHFHRQ